MTGRNMVNAIKIKNTPEARNRPKYIRDFPEGILLVEEKLPGRSLTPFENMLKVPETLSLAFRTAASRSKPGSEMAAESSWDSA